MKEWKKPSIINIDISKTMDESDYITICSWNTTEVYANGNEEYTDPYNKPAKHPDWVWCYVHNRWHPKDHTGDKVEIS